MRILSLLNCLIFILPTLSIAQTDHSRCGFESHMEQFYLSEPDAFDLHRQAEQYAEQMLPEVAAMRATDPTEMCPDGIRIIPVYMHVLHNGGSASFTGDNNFTVGEIQTAINTLNMHYQGTDPQLSRVQDQFWADGVISANTCIQFCWKTTDINRVDLSVPINAENVVGADGLIIDGRDSQISSTPQSKCQYLNLYTGRYGVGISGGGGLGHTWNIFSSFAGVRIDDNIFVPGGAITNPIDSIGVTTTHEIGHYFGLPHIWGKANIDSAATVGITASENFFCGIDDGMPDTPNQGRPSSGPGPGVPTYFQNEVIIQCGDTIMWTNYMDYSSNAWQVNFTKDQADFMDLYLTQAENLLPSLPGCDGSGGFLDGETICDASALLCTSTLINTPHDTVKICGSDTINFNQFTQDWGYNATVSAASEFSWRLGSLSGSLVGFPAKTIVSGNSPICTPDTLEFFLNIKCVTSGTEAFGGKVVVLSYLTAEELLDRYLRNGDCENGPGPVYSAADLAADCDELMTFTALNAPTFPTNVSGEVAYSVSFDSLVVGPCCTQPCVLPDTASFQCEWTPGQCPGVAYSGGFMTVLTPCPDLDFEDTYNSYETSLISVFDPNGYINDFYYYYDSERTEEFDTILDYIYDGDGCHFGSDITIYTAMGCDTNNSGTPNGYIPTGTITLSAPVPWPQAPTVDYSLNGDMDCVYSATPFCSADAVDPSPIPIEVCGASGLSDIDFIVTSEYGCVQEYTLAKPDCPDCGPPPGGCPGTTYAGGTETVCSGETMAAGFPEIELTGTVSPLNEVFWTNGPMGAPWVEFFPVQPDGLPTYYGPVQHSNPQTGVPELHIFFAHMVCDDDGDPETPSIIIPIGDYEVWVNPTPDGHVVPICLPSDSLNFYLEVELFSDPMGDTYTATNSYDASTLTFSAPGVQQLGPFPNAAGVSVEFSIDGGCAMTTDSFDPECLSSSCTSPEVLLSDTCVVDSVNWTVEYWVQTQLTGNTDGYLFEVTNDVNSDTVFMNLSNPFAGIGPFSTPDEVEITITNYTYTSCSTSSTVTFDPCLITGINDEVESEIRLFPNPSHGKVILQNLAGWTSESKILIRDATGKLLVQQTVAPSTSTNVEIDVSQLASGLYLVSVSDLATQRINVIRMLRY